MYSWFQTFAVFCMLYVIFWVIPRRLNCICRRFGTQMLLLCQTIHSKLTEEYRKQFDKKTLSTSSYGDSVMGIWIFDDNIEMRRMEKAEVDFFRDTKRE